MRFLVTGGAGFIGSALESRPARRRNGQIRLALVASGRSGSTFQRLGR